MPARSGKTTKAQRLEQEYAELMKRVQTSLPVPPYRDNLEQPSVLKLVETKTTYGAYEEPI